MKYAILKLIPIFALCLYCAELVQAKEWRGIVPLKSTRADVERLLGKTNGLGRPNLITNELTLITPRGVTNCKTAYVWYPKTPSLVSS